MPNPTPTETDVAFAALATEVFTKLSAAGMERESAAAATGLLLGRDERGNAHFRRRHDGTFTMFDGTPLEDGVTAFARAHRLTMKAHDGYAAGLERFREFLKSPSGGAFMQAHKNIAHLHERAVATPIAEWVLGGNVAPPKRDELASAMRAWMTGSGDFAEPSIFDGVIEQAVAHVEHKQKRDEGASPAAKAIASFMTGG